MKNILRKTLFITLLFSAGAPAVIRAGGMEDQAREKVQKGLKRRPESSLKELDEARRTKKLRILEAKENLARDLELKEKLQVNFWKAIYDENLAGIANTIQAGADINEEKLDGSTPLDETIDRSNIEIIKLLIASGVDVNKQGSGGYTPLMVAVEGGNTEMLELLIDNEAEVDLEASFKAEKFDWPNPWDLDEYFFSGHRDKSLTALMRAIEIGYVEMAELLIKNGADVDKEVDGFTPLIWAIMYDSTKMVYDSTKMIRLLIESGADIYKRSYGRTALEVAREAETEDEIEKLIKNFEENKKKKWLKWYWKQGKRGTTSFFYH